MVDWILPSIEDGLPPVTRPMTLLIVAGAAEGGAFAGRQAEQPEALEEVAADLLAEVRADRVVRPDQRLRRRETAIDRDVLGRGGPRHDSPKRAGRDKGEGNSRSRSHGRRFLPNLSVGLCGTQSSVSRPSGPAKALLHPAPDTKENTASFASSSGTCAGAVCPFRCW